MTESSGSQLASDLGYVFIRNYAINRLACKGVYLFDYRSILEELQVDIGRTSGCAAFFGSLP